MKRMILITILFFTLIKLNAQNILSVPKSYPTISSALLAALDGDSILVAPGIYVENINLSQSSISLTIKSDKGPDSTIIKPSTNNPILNIWHTGKGKKVTISGFSFTQSNSSGVVVATAYDAQILLYNCKVYKNKTAGSGGGISSSGNVTISNCIINENFAVQYGGGVFLTDGSQLINCIVSNNSVDTDGGGIYCTGKTKIINCSIVKNEHNTGGRYGAGIAMSAYLDSVLIMNSVIWGNKTFTAGWGSKCIYKFNGNLVFYNNYIDESVTSKISRESSTILTSDDPFSNYSNNIFSPHNKSKLINNGIKEISFYEYLVKCPDQDIKGFWRSKTDNYVDIGALESETPFVGVEENIVMIPSACKLLQNYPNPFNPSTTIEYQISQPSNVKINIYDVAGRLVKEIVNEQRNTGNYSIVWNGKDNSGDNVSSGTYFYQIQSGEYLIAKKMILLK